MVCIKLILKRSGLALLALMIVHPVHAADDIDKGAQLRISLSQSAMKSSPRAFGSTVIRRLPKGAAVTYLGRSGIYYHVSDGHQTGYVTSKSVVESAKFQSFSRSGDVTQSDMAAATKGFSPEVERENRKNRKLRYDLMDRAEKISKVADPETSLKGFRREGRLGEYVR